MESRKCFDYVLKLRDRHSKMNTALWIVRLHTKNENEPKFLQYV